MSERCVGAPALSAGRFISQKGGIVEEIMMNTELLGFGIPPGAIFERNRTCKTKSACKVSFVWQGFIKN